MLQVVIKYNYLPNMTVNRNKESWLRNIHPQPLCPFAKTKIKFVHYRKVVSLRRDKKKNIHHITRHIWLRLFTKASTHICLRYATANIRYAKTSSKIARAILLNGSRVPRCPSRRASDFAEQRVCEIRPARRRRPWRAVALPRPPSRN